MKRFLALFLVFNLTACTQFRDFTTGVKEAVVETVTPDNFDNVTIFYGTTLSIANGYYDLCEKKIINKKCWGIIETLQPYEKKAYQSYLVLKDYVKKNPNLKDATFTQLVIDAKDAITSFRTMQKNNGVK